MSEKSTHDTTSAVKQPGSPPPPPKVTKTRSPNYPSIPLDTAIKRARAILDGVGRSPTDPEVIAGLWKFSLKSSGFRLTMAAMRAFGLLVEQPGPKGDLSKLSNLALDILEDYPAGSAQQREAIKKAALTPKIHVELHEKYGAQLPADIEVRRYLIREREPRFNDNTVGDFITEYKKTMSFAGISPGDKILGADLDIDSAGDHDGNGDDRPAIRVGDFVQWSCNGADMFPEPRRVLGFYNDEYAYVEGNPTGLLVTELTTVDQKTSVTDVTKPPPANPFFAPVAKPDAESRNPPLGFKQATLPLETGEMVVRWPESVTADEVRDFEEWVPILIRKMKRSRPGGLPSDRE